MADPIPTPAPAAPSWWEKWGPLVKKVMALLLAALGGGAAINQALPAKEKEVPVPVPVYLSDPPVKQGVAEGLPEGRLRKRLAIAVVRAQVVERAVRDGIVTPGGGVRKVTREEARKLVDRVGDDTIEQAAIVYGAPIGEGKIQQFLTWLWEHREEIIAFILKILPLFLVLDDGGQM